MHFTRVKALWPERQNFYLKRNSTGDEYIFLHLLTPVKIMIDGEWTRAETGACILYNKFDHQEFYSDECPLLHDYFHLSGNIDRLMENFGLQYGKLYYPQSSAQITGIIQRIERETLKKDSFYNQICGLKLTELLILISRADKKGADGESVDSATYERFIELRKEIHSKFNANLSVTDMAEMINLSPSRFHSIYKTIFGISPKKDYLNIRIEHAKSLLMEDKYSVSEIAEMVGYNNQFHFIRQFRDAVGVTPGKYMKSEKESSKVRTDPEE